MIYFVVNSLLIISGLALVSLLIVRRWISRKGIEERRERYAKGLTKSLDSKVVAFFHPYCNAGGGGERVLWCAVRALHRKYPSYHYVVYTGDTDCSADQIIRKVNTNFKINLDFEIEFIYLNKRKYVESDLYPYFTLLGQSLGSIVLALEALTKCVPNVYIDSMGYSFSFLVFKYLADCKIGAYVHYPTISTDMLQLVSDNITTYNNRQLITNSLVLSKAKLIYYKIFAYLYGIVGRIANVVMVNSSWTQQHIQYLWNTRTHVVYPPCNTTDFKTIALQRENKYQIVSIGQIRPEKNHALQLNAFKDFITRLKQEYSKEAKLVIIGSCRNADDENRVKQLKELARVLNITGNVEFKLNVTYDELKQLIQHSNIGLHTMKNEHFGIGVVECLASGLITIAHDSGGPKMDIITANVNGFLAADVEQFSDILLRVVNMSNDELNDIRVKARKSVDKFSEEEFESSFLKSMNAIL